MTDLRTAARALGGEVSGRGVLCPGPGHSSRDRSLSVTFSPTAPDGFTLFSHAGDDFGACRDYVRARLGFGRPSLQRERVAPPPSAGEGRIAADVPTIVRPEINTASALRIWHEAEPPPRTPVEAYLARRGLALPEDAAAVLRYHPACPFAGQRVPSMVALVRNVVSNEPQAIHRTALSLQGQKIEVNGKDRLALGALAGGAVKLTPDEEVSTCLGIGEGIETTLSLRGLFEFGDTPVWSLLNAGGITAFPVLAGVECLWLAVDHDPAGERAAEACAARWRTAGREVFRVKARAAGADLNDLREVRRA